MSFQNKCSPLTERISNAVFEIDCVDCIYPISGQYGVFPRYLYYALVAVSVLSSVFYREPGWIATTAVGSVMAYSGVAAVHAIALFAIREDLLAPSSQVTMQNSITYRVRPQVWDLDSDVVLAIVGIGFLVLIPMQAYSKTFQKSEAKRVLLLWSILLLIGMIFAVLNWVYVKQTYVPQFRFCTANSSSDSSGTVNKKCDSRIFDSTSGESFNTTIWKALNISDGHMCVSPCFSAKWALRSNAEISVVDKTGPHMFHFLSISPYMFVLVGSSVFCCLTIFLVKTLGWDANLQELKASIKRKLKNFILFLWPRGYMKTFLLFRFGDRRPLHNRQPFLERWTIGNIAKVSSTFCLFVIDLCAIFLSPLALLGFAFSTELIVLQDPPGESLQNVGQWGTIVSTVLIFVAAFTAEYGHLVTTFIADVVAKFRSGVSIQPSCWCQDHPTWAP